jgi:hypothetical protein
MLIQYVSQSDPYKILKSGTPYAEHPVYVKTKKAKLQRTGT